MVPNVTTDEFKTARVYATTADLLKFLTLLNREPYRSALRDSSGVIEKNGGSDGVRAQIWTNTRLHYSFVLLSNYDEWPFQQTITDMVSLLEDKPYTLPAPLNRKIVTIAAGLPQRYAGIYDFAEANHTLIEFRAAHGQLEMYQDGVKQADLLAGSDTVFFDDPKSKDGFTFLPDGDHWKVIWDFKGVQLTGRRK